MPRKAAPPGGARRRAACLLALLLALAPPAHPQDAPGAAAVRVVVDPRIELMSAVQLLAGYRLVTRHDFAYRRDVQAYFAPHADHAAVRLFREMSGAGFAFSSVPDAMLSLEAPPGLAPRADVSPEVLRAAGGEARLWALVDALRAFAAETGFAAFFRAHAGTHALLAERARAHVEPAVAALEAYTGRPLAGATVVLGPLLHDGGFAAQYRLPGGRLEAYAFVGPERTRDGLPDFGDARRLGSLVTHEFAHLAVNPLTARYGTEVERTRALYGPMEEAMRRQAYGRWETALNEHVVRAITTRLAFRERGEAAGREELEEHLRRGFTHLPALLERLQRYEAERERYPTLEDFYPRLLEVFAEAAAAGAR